MPYTVDEIIQKLTDIEGAAGRIIAGSEDEKSQKKAEHDKRIAEYDRVMEAEVNKELESIRSELKKEESEQLSALKQEAEQNEKKLEALYAMNHDKWAETIFRSIVEV